MIVTDNSSDDDTYKMLLLIRWMHILLEQTNTVTQ